MVGEENSLIAIMENYKMNWEHLVQCFSILLHNQDPHGCSFKCRSLGHAAQKF